MKRPKRIKACRMWQHYTGDMHQFADGSLSPIAVLDISDPDALVEQASRAVVDTAIKLTPDSLYVASCEEMARAVLENLNIIPKRKGARRG